MSDNRTCPTGSFSYTIKSGDTLFKLAMTYNTTVEAIMRLNPGINPNNLQIGQRICIPGRTTPPRQCPTGSFSYTIKSGDTLFKLAMTYNTTVDAIMRLNPGINPNNLQIGQMICIPEGTTPPRQCPTGSFSYTIKSGDTLFNLARTFNTTVEAIMALNPGINPNNLQIGQVICIPSTTPPRQCPTGSFSYTIKSGDTLFNLARTFNTTVEAIMALNPGINPNNLQIGQVICIPSTTPPRQCPTGSFPYTIRSGDTLFNLARTFNTTVEAIIAINPGIDPNNLQIGQVICIPSTTPRPCPTGSFPYTIRSGDTLFNLARTFNTTVEAIIAINPGIDPNNLQIGQVICIPSTTPRPCPTGSFPYTIRSGDTLFNLARTFNTTVEAIIAINPGIDPNNLQIGQVICIPSTTPRPCPTGSFPYTIRSGDTLFNLARTFNTTVEAIIAINPGIDPNNLQIGQVICIPSTTPRPCPTGSFPYTIRSGDTLFNLARTFNTTVEAIIAINPGIDPNNLQIGQVICIPNASPMPPCPPCNGVYYTVRSGDTLFSIAMMFNVSLQALMAANPGVDPNNLMVGQLICIPRGEVPCPGGTMHTVTAGETATDIMLRYNISWMTLTDANPNVDLNNLRVGQELCIMPHKEMGCPCTPGYKQYKIDKSDIPSTGSVIAGLARKFNTTVAELLMANPTLSPGDFVEGKIICVPGM